MESCAAATSDSKSSISETSVSASSFSASTTVLSNSFACPRKVPNNWLEAVSQNSSWAVLCKRFLTRSTSLAPGNSTRIRPEVPKRWMFGWVTPNLSIRLRNTSNAETIEASIFLRITGLTSSSAMLKLMSSLKVRFPKISGLDRLSSPFNSSKAKKKLST